MTSLFSDSLSLVDLKKAYDSTCRSLLCFRSVLAPLLKETLPPFASLPLDFIERLIESERDFAPLIRGRFNESFDPAEGKIVFDVLFDAALPSSPAHKVIINVEPQRDFYPGYPLVTRGLYYASRLITSQYGTEFVSSDYQNLCSVFSIWICLEPPKALRGSLSRYAIGKEQVYGEYPEDPSDYDKMTVCLLCLYEEDRPEAPWIIRFLSVLFSPKLSAEAKRTIFEKDFQLKMNDDMKKEVKRCAISATRSMIAESAKEW